MEITFKRTRVQAAQSFLKFFYHQKPWRFLRIIGGPFIILIGYLLLQFPYTWHRGFSYFSIGFGIYYMIRPLVAYLIILRRPEESVSTLSLDVETKILRTSSDLGNSEIQLREPFITKIGKWGLIIGDKKLPQLRLAVPGASVIQGDWEALAEISF